MPGGYIELLKYNLLNIKKHLNVNRELKGFVSQNKIKISTFDLFNTFSGLLLLPTFVKDLPPWFKKYVYRGELKLGLDLKGGVHLVLRPDLEKALKPNLIIIYKI